MVIPQRGGLPHSDIPGSKPARGSPGLFAACHVLHRLLAPRHPPDALLMLQTSRSSPSQSRNHRLARSGQTQSAGPAMHRNHPRPNATGRNAPPIPQQAIAITQHTHSNAPEPCSHTSNQTCHHPLMETATRSGSDTHASTATDTPAQPRTQPHHAVQRGRNHPKRPARPETHQNLIHNP